MSYYSERHYVNASYRADELYYKMFFKKGMKILDIGCSIGNFVAQDSANIVGIDMDKDQLAIAKKMGLKVFYHNADKRLDFRNESFDGVNCRHVIEHLKDPLKFMKDAHRILKKNGKLVLMTPDIETVKFKFWHGYVHIRPFTKSALKKIAYDSGFRKFEVYKLPQGVFGFDMLYRLKLLKPSTAKRLEKIIGKILNAEALVLEAYK